MHPLASLVSLVALSLALVVSSEAFFLRWGSDTTRQSVAPKQWYAPNMSPAYKYQYAYAPYEMRKYPVQPTAYSQPDIQVQAEQQAQSQAPVHQMPPAPIPISVPAGANLTPVSLQHVQLVPCMCPVAPEEAERLHEQLGPGPYLAQTYQPTPPATAQP